MTYHYDVEQRSEAWRLLRAGKLTGSEADALLSNGRGGKESADRRNLRAKLVAERLTGQPQGEDRQPTAAMLHGVEKEATAIAAYEARAGLFVTPVGFVSHDDLIAGCSPDGLVGHDGLIEVKCPLTATHLGYFDNPALLLDVYRAQVLHGLWITQRSWCDLISFDDRLPPHLQLAIVRYDAHAEKHTAEIASYELLARQFIEEVYAAVVRYALPAVQEVA